MVGDAAPWRSGHDARNTGSDSRPRRRRVIGRRRAGQRAGSRDVDPVPVFRNAAYTMTPSPLPAIACRPPPLLGRLPKTPVCPTYAPGAAATAALLSGVVHLPKGSRVVAIVSGDNVDPE